MDGTGACGEKKSPVDWVLVYNKSKFSSLTNRSMIDSNTGFSPASATASFEVTLDTAQHQPRRNLASNLAVAQLTNPNTSAPSLMITDFNLQCTNETTQFQTITATTPAVHEITPSLSQVISTSTTLAATTPTAPKKHINRQTNTIKKQSTRHNCSNAFSI